MPDAKISSGRISGNCGFVAKRFRGLRVLREPTGDAATTFGRSYGPSLFLQNISQGARKRGRCPQKATDMLVVELSGASRGESA